MQWVSYGLMALGLAVASVGAAAIPPQDGTGAPAETALATAAIATAVTSAGPEAGTTTSPVPTSAAPAPKRGADDRVHWTTFLVGFLMLGTGVVMTQVRRRSELKTAREKEGHHRDGPEHEMGGAVGALAALRRVSAEVSKLRENIESLKDQEVLDSIDRLLLGDLLAIGQARQEVADRLGPVAYAEMMSEFAVGERYLNRTWSATADGYRGEAETSLGRSAPAFLIALGRFDEAMKGAPEK